MLTAKIKGRLFDFDHVTDPPLSIELVQTK